MCQLKKKTTHNLKVENEVFCGLTEDLSLGNSLSKIPLKDCSEEMRKEEGGTRII